MDASTELSLRQGPNDRQIEVYRDGVIQLAFLSSLAVGEVFRLLDGNQEDVWFLVKEPLRRSSMRGGSTPSFSFGGLEITQAPSIESRIQKNNKQLESPRPKLGFTPRLLSNNSITDIEDV